MTIAPVRVPDASQRIADTTHLLLVGAAHVPGPRRQELLDEVVLLNAPIARSLASRYRSRGVDPDDLEQVAYLGLVKAANGYRPDGATPFLAYAVPTIRGELKRYFRDFAWTVRPPRRLQELQGSIAAAEPELTQRLGRLPSDEETAAELGAGRVEITEAGWVRGCFTAVSLDAPAAADDGGNLIDTMAECEHGYDRVENVHTLAPVVSGLGARDQHLLSLRFQAGLTQEEIGQQLGISQMQVSRRLRGILDRLRDDLTTTMGR